MDKTKLMKKLDELTALAAAHDKRLEMTQVLDLSLIHICKRSKEAVSGSILYSGKQAGKRARCV